MSEQGRQETVHGCLAEVKNKKADGRHYKPPINADTRAMIGWLAKYSSPVGASVARGIFVDTQSSARSRDTRLVVVADGAPNGAPFPRPRYQHSVCHIDTGAPFSCLRPFSRKSSPGPLPSAVARFKKRGRLTTSMANCRTSTFTALLVPRSGVALNEGVTAPRIGRAAQAPFCGAPRKWHSYCNMPW
jgi:hypothetical protein